MCGTHLHHRPSNSRTRCYSAVLVFGQPHAPFHGPTTKLWLRCSVRHIGVSGIAFNRLRSRHNSSSHSSHTPINLEANSLNMPSSDDASSTSSMKSPRSSTSTRATQSTAASSPETNFAPLPPGLGPLPPIPQALPPPPPPPVHAPFPQAQAQFPQAQAPFPQGHAQLPQAHAPPQAQAPPPGAQGGPGYGGGNFANTTRSATSSDSGGSIRSFVMSPGGTPAPSSPPFSAGLVAGFANVDFYQGGGATQQSSGVHTPATRGRHSMLYGGAYATNHPDGSRRRSDVLPNPSAPQYDPEENRRKSGDVEPPPKPRRQG